MHEESNVHDDGHVQSEHEHDVSLDELADDLELEDTDELEDAVDLEATDDLEDSDESLEESDDREELEHDETDSQHSSQSAVTQPQLALATFTPPVMRNLFE